MLFCEITMLSVGGTVDIGLRSYTMSEGETVIRIYIVYTAQRQV